MKQYKIGFLWCVFFLLTVINSHAQQQKNTSEMTHLQWLYILDLAMDEKYPNKKLIDKGVDENWKSRTIEGALYRAENRVIDKNYSGALQDLSVVLKFEPNNAKAILRIGECRQNLKDYNGAIIEYTKYLALQAKDYPRSFGVSAAYSNRGQCKYNLQKNQEAILDFDKALNINNNLSLTYLLRGGAKIRLKQKSGGCADLRKALELGEERASFLIEKLCN
jgi:tetratricopeptide (TPR) repeat protein